MFAWIAGLAGLAAAGVASYGATAPQSELFGKTLHRLADPKQLALTFDDGPNDPHTLRLLDVLAKHSVKATFFMIGKYVDLRPDIVRDVVAAGHTVGNHTYSHPNLIFRTRGQVVREIRECDRALTDAVGNGH